MAETAWHGFDDESVVDAVDVLGVVASESRELLDDVGLAAMAARVEPGPTMMAMLCGLELSALPVTTLIDVAAAWQRQAGWVAARTAVALAALNDAPAELEPSFAGAAGRALVDAGSLGLTPAQAEAAALAEAEWRCEELAAVLRWPPVAADRKLGEASRLTNQLPATLAALESGAISDRHAGALLEVVEECDDTRARAVEALVLARASGQTAAEFRRSARRAALRVDPGLAVASRAKAAAERGVRVRPLPDGMAALIATVTAEDAQTVFMALDAAAAGRRCDETRVDALRADTLLAWAQHALAEPDLPRRHGRRVELQVVIDLSTLLGLAEHPADLVGYGPIPPEADRALATDAAWRRLVVEPVTGHLLDYGHTVYRPPQPLTDFLINRDRRCRFPGCHRAADACDLDHVIPYDQGGPTASANMAALCRRHHRLKTHGGWRLEIDDDGAVTWTSPHGRLFHVDPPPQLT